MQRIAAHCARSRPTRPGRRPFPPGRRLCPREPFPGTTLLRHPALSLAYARDLVPLGRSLGAGAEAHQDAEHGSHCQPLAPLARRFEHGEAFGGAERWGFLARTIRARIPHHTSGHSNVLAFEAPVWPHHEKLHTNPRVAFGKCGHASWTQHYRCSATRYIPRCAAGISPLYMCILLYMCYLLYKLPRTRLGEVTLSDQIS